MSAQLPTIYPQAERAFLACLIRNPDIRTALDNGITPDHFAVPACREAFEAIAAYLANGTPPDAATLSAAVADATLIETETSLKENASAANAHVYAKLLRDAKRQRDEQAARARLVAAVSAGAPDHELQAIIESIRQISRAEPAKSRFQWAEDFCRNDAIEDDLIDGYLPANSIGVMFGDSEAYKSFLLIDMAGHIATGLPWRGRDVKRGKVAFIAGEGGNGLKTRIMAWFERHRQPMRDFAVSIVPLELCDPKNVDLLVADIKDFIGDEPVALIVLDTLNTHFGAGDENSTADMTRFRSSVLKMSQATGATVAISHHCGISDKTRSRGNISLHNGIDWEFRLERGGDYTTLTATKTKDREKPPPLSWKLIQQRLPWLDKKENPINGAVLEPVDAQPAQDRTPHRVTGKNRIALSALETALIQHGTETGGIVSVDEGQWRQAAYTAGIAADDATQNARRMAFNRAREALVSAERVTCSNGRYWIPSSRTTAQNRTEPHICAVVRDEGKGCTPAQTAHTPYKGVCGVRCAGAPHQFAEPDTDLDGAIAAQWRNSDGGDPLTAPFAESDSWCGTGGTGGTDIDRGAVAEPGADGAGDNERTY